MPRLIPYDQQVVPQNQLQVQASPEDFGAATGRGIRDLGAGMESLNTSINDVEQDKAKVWAINAASEARLGWLQKMEQMQTDPEFAKKYGEDGSGFAGTFKTEFEDYASNAIATAPSGAAKRFMELQLHNVGEGLMNQAINFQSVTGAKWSGVQLSKSAENYGRAAFMSPQNYQAIQMESDFGIDVAPHLTPDVRAAYKMQQRESIAFAAGKGQAQQNPEALLATLAPEELMKFKPTSRVVKALNANVSVTLPKNLGANIVKPYAADKIAHIATKTREPSEYDAMISLAAQTHGVDATELKMRLVAESNLDPKAVSSQGAGGLAQFTAATAKGYGVTDRFDPQQAIFGAAKILADLQGKAAGDISTVDQMYYGGESGSNWGKNTAQYAENLAAVRASMNGNTEAPPATFEQVLASVLSDEDKTPVRSKAMPEWFNELPWEKQYAIIEDAKQGVVANQTREAQLVALEEKQRELQEKQSMSDGIDRLIDGSLTVDQIRNDPALGYEGKRALLTAINSDLAGKNKTDPTVFNDLFQRINAAPGDPKRISDETELVKYVGKGIAFEQLGQLRKEIQDKGTPEGSLKAELKTAFLKQAYSRLVKSSMFQAVDPTQAQNYYNFEQTFRTAFDQRVRSGANPLDLLDPNHKDYMGNLIQQFDRSPQQVMADMAEARRRQLADPENSKPVQTVPMTPQEKGALPVITTEAEYNQLEKGQKFKDEKGEVWTK